MRCARIWFFARLGGHRHNSSVELFGQKCMLRMDWFLPASAGIGIITLHGLFGQVCTLRVDLFLPASAGIGIIALSSYLARSMRCAPVWFFARLGGHRQNTPEPVFKADFCGPPDGAIRERIFKICFQPNVFIRRTPTAPRRRP